MAHPKITPCGELILSAASTIANNIDNKILHRGHNTPHTVVPAWQAIRTGLSRCKKATIRIARSIAVTRLAPKYARGARPATNRVEEPGKLILILT